MATIVVSSGETFKHPNNIRRNSVSGSWCPIGNAVSGRDVEIVGVYWNPSGSAGQILKIRDAAEDIWYSAVSTGATAGIDFLDQPLTLKTPFEYLCSEEGNTIIIHGRYI